MSKIQEVKDLNSQLISARHAYYVEAQPVMSDVDYDKFERKLMALVAADGTLERYATVLTTVGSDLRDSANRVRHTEPMLSLENKYTLEEIGDWYDSLPLGTIVGTEPKIDGLSLSLRYIDRKLVLATTRGDGKVGEEATVQAFASPSIPKNLHKDFPETMVEVRGEAFITTHKLDELNEALEADGKKPYANTRNLAAGTLKLRDTEEVARRDIRFHPWQVLGLPEDPLGASKDLDFLYKHNEFGKPHWRQPLVVRASSRQELIRQIQSLGQAREKTWHKGLGMLTDGVVIKVEDKKLRKKLGMATKFPNWACCFKFQSMSGVTTLKDVIWQTGRSGILTPVGELEPINLGGSVISRVNLNNMSFINELGLTKGCKIDLVKSGDVIPMVTSCVEAGTTKISAPTVCPECGCTDIQEAENPKSKVIVHYCTNSKCGGMLKTHLVYIGQRQVLDIEGLGPQIAEKFVDDGVIESIGDLYLWAQTMDKQLQVKGDEWLEKQIKKEGWPVAQTMELLQGLKSSLHQSWDKWIAALGIPGVGDVFGKKLAQYLELGSEDMPKLASKLLTLSTDDGTMEGLGVKRFDAIASWCQDSSNQEILDNLYAAGVRPKPVSKPAVVAGGSLAGVTICVTGEFPEVGEREYIHACLQSLGAVIKGISKKLNLVVAGDGAGPSKLAKVKDFGIQLEGRIWLHNIFKSNNLAFKPRFDAEDVMDDL